MEGKRIAVLGLGRSGLAIGNAARQLGAQPIIYDETPADQIAKPALVDEAFASGLDVRFGGVRFDPKPDILVLNPAIAPNHPVIAMAQELGVEVIGEIEFAYRISKAPIVAITGTNGKSTTTVMTYECLQSCGCNAVLCGNIFGSGYAEMPLTEAALASTPDQVLVAEISSFQLEWIVDFHPRAAAITNITSDHLDRHGSVENYARTKQRLFENMTADDTAIYPASLEPITGARRVAVDVDHPEPDVPVIGGRHQRANAVMAVRLCQAILGAETVPECATDAIGTFKGLTHRMEILGDRGGVTVINNSMCTNPAAVVSSIEGLSPRVHLLMGGVNKGLDFAPLREYLHHRSAAIYLFGTDALQLSKMLATSSTTYRTMEEAFKAATDSAASGDTIILAPGCASTDQFRDFRHRGDVFKAIAMEWLHS